ncbi:SMI1/KNR4 family protein [Corynebacterium sp. A21]|uniref:SMI1/KNR4 family protein n=1 Tax=Corynebacterium sp. A21 TaxID=3457318 RepID=UPI003FD61D62
MSFPVTEARIRAAEKELGRQLPTVWLERFKVNNGGEVEDHLGDGWELHPIRDDSDRKRLSRTACDIVRETASARKWPDFLHEGVAIASDGTGDAFGFLPGSDEIYIWSHRADHVGVTDAE